MRPIDIVMLVFGAYMLVMVYLAVFKGFWWQTIVVTVTLFYLLKYVTHIRKPGETGFAKFDTSEQVTEGMDLSGKVFFVTGPTSGIGEDTAQTLALRGAKVIMAARSEAKLAASKSKIEEYCATNGVTADLVPVKLDLASLESVRAGAKAFLEMNLPLHVLIENAGVMATPEGKTVDGFETQVGINHIGHFLLAQLLTPKLKESAPSRVVVLTSSAHALGQKSYFSKDNTHLDTTPYNPWHAYGNAKLSNMMFAREYNKRHQADGITAVSVHPGGIHTGLQGHVDKITMFKWIIAAPFFFKTIPEGSATTVICATIAELNPGAFYEDSNPSVPYADVRDLALDDELCEWLYDTSLQLIK